MSRLDMKGHSPEAWMSGAPAGAKDESVARLAAKETIRQWYERTTKTWRKGLVWATVAAMCGGAVFYAFSSFAFMARLQTFNGALTIPIAALIWMLTFVFIFLVPSREASFRSQEWIESMVALVEQAVREQVAPAAVVWRRLGERFERDVPGFLQEVRDGMDTVKKSAASLEAAVQKNDKVADEAKPVIEALRKLSERAQKEVDTGLFEELRDAAKSIKNFGTPSSPAEAPNVDKALAALGRGPVRR